MGKQFDWLRAIKAGEVMAVENARMGQELKPEHAIWELLKEAASVSHIAYGGPPRSGYPAKSAMPEAPDDISMWVRVMEYLRGIADEMPEAANRPAQPSVAQIDRCEAILEIWHKYALTRRGARNRLRNAVYSLACGVPVRKITARSGVKRTALYRARDDAMRDMLTAIQNIAK